MKEATSELSSSALVFGAVVLLSFFFFSVIWPNIKGNMQKRASCADAVCDVGYNQNLMAYCYTPHEDGSKSEVFECPYRG